SCSARSHGLAIGAGALMMATPQRHRESGRSRCARRPMIDTPFQFNAGRIMVRRAKTIHRAKACSHAKAWRVVAAVTAAGVLAGLACAPAQAQGKLDARYTASLAGLKLGSGAWVVDVTDKQY